jgi:hypothetical protein
MAFCAARGLAPLQLVSTGPAVVDGERSASGMVEQLGCGLTKKMSDMCADMAFTTARWTAGSSFGAVVDRNKGA